ncbi:hypothetical protein [Streptomyces sp. FH025]|uniref:hypothetical protein n=1 Tax=Streptomyces sp. FH025 TaxID=2815937 RepID=UPI001A9E4C08|nr:hypothetical protein [Streptomyces sp. FH025]MBO1420336.1 hypothetical protein [Streptomyces sp. FH025]
MPVGPAAPRHGRQQVEDLTDPVDRALRGTGTALALTLLAAGSVLLAALGEPSWWRALAVTVLLADHLLPLDTLGPAVRASAPPPRPPP